MIFLWFILFCVGIFVALGPLARVAFNRIFQPPWTAASLAWLPNAGVKHSEGVCAKCSNLLGDQKFLKAFCV
jgi:hypothetical protein